MSTVDMKLGDESLKAVRAAHFLGMAVAAIALVLLFAPFEADFRDALKEARLLMDQKSLLPFEQYARAKVAEGFANPDFLPSEPGIDPYVGIQLVYFVDHKLDICCVSPDPPNDWSVAHALDYDPAPISKPLEAWPAWTSSRTPIRYWKPEWASASVLTDTRKGIPAKGHGLCGEVDCRPDDYRVLRYFAVRPVIREGSSWSSIPTYEFLAFFESGLRQSASGTPAAAEWWHDVEEMPAAKRSDKAWIEGIGQAGRSVVVGQVPLSHVVGVGQREAGDPGSIQDWLRYDATSRGIFDMPHLQEHWSVLEKKTLREAIAYMEAQQRRLRDVSLFGIAVPGELCAVAIPLAFALTHLLLLLHLRSCNNLLAEGNQPPHEHFPWIGLYKEKLAQFVTALSITAIPVSLTALLIFRFHSRLGFSSTVPAAMLGAVTAGLSWYAMVDVGALRRQWWSSATSDDRYLNPPDTGRAAEQPVAADGAACRR